MQIKKDTSLREKILALSNFIREKYQLELDRALSLKPNTIDKIIKGERQVSFRILKKLSEYFSLPLKVLKDETLPLPPLESLNLDEDLISIQKNDVATVMKRLKQKNFFKHSWFFLSYRKKVRLIFSILLITLPLLVFILYCGSKITFEKINTLRLYKEGSEQTLYDTHNIEQVHYHELLDLTSKTNNKEAYYVEVKVGVLLERIKNISPSDSHFEARMQVYYKFDKEEFRQMFRHYTENVLMDQVIDDYFIEHQEENRTGKNIDFKVWKTTHEEYFTNWIELNDHRFYPGETPTNVLIDKETIFDIGNGEFVADSFGTLKELEEVQYYDELGVLKTMCYQKVKFNALFEKTFDSVRYPLDSVQFNMYLLPVLDANYIRYVPDDSVNKQGEQLSGFAPNFSITSGYRVIKNTENIKNFTMRINYYYAVNNDPAVPFEHTMRTQLEVLVRANRAGITLFLQAFVNLFSVIIWIIIAFYSQSHTGEDSISMLGTGLFGAISSILIGLSMLSDADIFSLITMINIFTLVVILIMTYQAIAAKRANAKNDKVSIAYNGIKLRILFYILSLCTIVMFVVLPILSYIWKL